MYSKVIFHAALLLSLFTTSSSVSVDPAAKKYALATAQDDAMSGFPAAKLKELLTDADYKTIASQYRRRETLSARQLADNATLAVTARNAWACGGPPVLTGWSSGLPFAWLALSPPGNPFCRAIARGFNCSRYCYATPTIKFCYLNCPGIGFGGTLGYPLVLSSTNYVLVYAFGPFYPQFACNIQDYNPGSPICYV